MNLEILSNRTHMLHVVQIHDAIIIFREVQEEGLDLYPPENQWVFTVLVYSFQYDDIAYMQIYNQINTFY